MEKIKIEQLVANAKKGNFDDMMLIINAYRPLVLKQVKKYSFLMNSDDIISHCNLSIVLAINKYKLEKKCFSTYVRNAIENNLKNEFRGKSYYETPTDFTTLIASDLNCMEDDIVKKILTEQLQKAIDQLSSYEKRLIDFRFFKDYPLRQIAEIENSNIYKIDKELKEIICKLKDSF